MPLTHKPCFRCKEVKAITEFYVHPQMGDGRLNKCKTCTRADVRANYEANIAYYREYDKARGYRPGDEQKVSARNAVAKAVRRGELAPLPCEMSGDHAGRMEAHHEDYSKPLMVQWLCKKHHGEVHTSAESAA